MGMLGAMAPAVGGTVEQDAGQATAKNSPCHTQAAPASPSGTILAGTSWG